jgi:hypothetical protein
VDSGFHGAQAEFEHIRDFVVAQVFIFEENKWDPVFDRKRIHGSLNKVIRFGSL